MPAVAASLLHEYLLVPWKGFLQLELPQQHALVFEFIDDASWVITCAQQAALGRITAVPKEQYHEACLNVIHFQAALASTISTHTMCPGLLRPAAVEYVLARSVHMVCAALSCSCAVGCTPARVLLDVHPASPGLLRAASSAASGGSCRGLIPGINLPSHATCTTSCCTHRLLFVCTLRCQKATQECHVTILRC